MAYKILMYLNIATSQKISSQLTTVFVDNILPLCLYLSVSYFSLDYSFAANMYHIFWWINELPNLIEIQNFVLDIIV